MEKSLIWQDKNAMVNAVIKNLSDHSGAPNRNKIGITFNEHFTKITELQVRKLYVYQVDEYKGNSMIGNIFSLGIRSGMITGAKYYIVD